MLLIYVPTLPFFQSPPSDPETVHLPVLCVYTFHLGILLTGHGHGLSLATVRLLLKIVHQMESDLI